MIPTWTRKYFGRIATNKTLAIRNTFDSEYLVFTANCFTCRDTWHRAGYLTQSISSIPFRQIQVEGSKTILLNTPTLLTFNHYQLGYQLSFEPVNWIKSLTLEIYQPSMPLYASNADAPFSSTTAVTTSVTVNSNTNPVLLLAANSSRKSFSLKNKGSKSIAIGFTVNMTLVDCYLTLDRAVIYVPEFNYKGAIYGLTIKNNDTSDLAITEFT